MNALVLDTVPIWTVILGFGVFLYVLLDGFDLGVGALRARAGHAVPQSCDELHRANLGWQRDLARARGPCAPGGVSAGLRHHNPCRVLPRPGHVARPGLPRRCIRVPVSRRAAQDLLGLWICLWIRDRDVRAGCRPRVIHSGLRS